LEVHRSVDGVPFRLLLTMLPPDIARHRLHSATLCENLAKKIALACGHLADDTTVFIA